MLVALWGWAMFIFSHLLGVGHQSFVPLRGGGSCLFRELGFHFLHLTPPPPPPLVLFDQPLIILRLRSRSVAVGVQMTYQSNPCPNDSPGQSLALFFSNSVPHLFEQLIATLLCPEPSAIRNYRPNDIYYLSKNVLMFQATMAATTAL